MERKILLGSISTIVKNQDLPGTGKYPHIVGSCERDINLN